LPQFAKSEARFAVKEPESLLAAGKIAKTTAPRRFILVVSRRDDWAEVRAAYFASRDAPTK
jgi:hypothetical protein